MNLPEAARMLYGRSGDLPPWEDLPPDTRAEWIALTEMLYTGLIAVEQSCDPTRTSA